MYEGSLTADAEMVVDGGTFRLYGGTIDGRTIGLRTELTVQDGEVYLYGGTIGREITLYSGELYLSGTPKINRGISIEAVGYAIVHAAADGAPYTGDTVDIDYTILQDAEEGADIVLGLSDSNRDRFDVTLRDDSDGIFQAENDGDRISLGYRSFTVRYVGADGSVLYATTAEYGSPAPEYSGDTPGKDADADYTYTFSG